MLRPIRSASSSCPWIKSHRGLSGTLRRTSMIPSPRIAPTAKAMRQPMSLASKFSLSNTMAGAAAAIVLLNENLLAKDIGWRIAFAVGAILGLGIMLVRRSVPESPRWLFIHGQEEEAERIVRSIEEDVQDETGEPLDEVHDTIKVRQRERIPFGEIRSEERR